MELITGENDDGRRLDRLLRKALPDYSLPLIHRLIRQKKVLINGKPGKPDDRPAGGAKITILSLKDKPSDNFSSDRPKAENHNKKRLYAPDASDQLQILWEGDGLLAVNKPAGIAVHGPDSLETAVRSYLKNKLPPSLSFKPGPLHRLDKPSSGIVVFSAGLEGARFFCALMKEHKIKKTYTAIVEGSIKKDMLWQNELVRDKEKKKTFVSEENPDSKSAVTKIIPLAAKNGYSLIKAEIVTGRTHQIRAQAAFHGHPLAGDVKYGGKAIANEQFDKQFEISNKKAVFFLHAQKLEFPKSGEPGQRSIEAPLPKEFQEMINALYLFI